MLRSAVLLATYTLAVLIVLYHHSVLPEPRGFDAPADQFSEARAFAHVNAICSMGIPRHVGSANNELHAPRYLEEQMRALQALAQQTGGHHFVEIDIQRPNGKFDLDFLDGLSSSYHNITNVLLRVSPAATGRESTPPAVLLSAHYDAVIGSLGASDDMAAVAVLLEVVRSIIAGPPLKNAVVLILNGAEENILQASHGFATAHPWMDGVKAFVNIEACGAGGREIVFQTGPGNPWIARLYADVVPRPHISVIAQEVFQAELIPSDTDFRIYRDFGHIPGIDMAWYENGYVYHTPRDAPDQIRPGTLQHTGDNVLPLVRGLGNSAHLGGKPSEEHAEGHLVFFDLFGVIMVMLDGSSLRGLAVVVVAVQGLVLVGLARQEGRNALQRHVQAHVAHVATLLAAVITPALVGLALTILNVKLSWYATWWLVLPLFVVPALWGGAWAVWTFAPQHQLHGAATGERDAHIARVAFWLLAALLLSVCQLGAGLLALVQASCALLARAFSDRLARRRQPTLALAVRLALGEFIPSLLMSWCIFRPVLAMFVPLMGRSGPSAPSDVVVGAILGFCVAIMTSTGSSLYLTFPQPRGFRRLGVVIFAVALILAANCFPYSESPPRLKRLFLQHTIRKVHSAYDTVHTDSGVWINTMDALDLQPVMHLDGYSRARKAVRTGVYGGFPWYFPLAGLINSNWFIPDTETQTAAGLGLRHAAELLLTQTPPIPVAGRPGRQSRSFNATLSAGDHACIYLQPCQAGGKTIVTAWSLGDGGAPKLNKMDHHFVFLSTGSPSQTWTFWFVIEEDAVKPADCPASLGLAVAGHHLEQESAALSQLKGVTPTWATTTAWISTFESWLL